MEENEFMEFCRTNEKEGALMLIFALLVAFGDIFLSESSTTEE